MVSMIARALLAQSLFVSMIGAERMKMAGIFANCHRRGTPAENLQSIFKDNKNQICGGEEVRNELTKGTTVGGMRTTNWDRVLKIASAYLDDVNIDIPTLSAEIKTLEGKLKVAEADSKFTNLKKHDIARVVRKTITKPHTFMDLEKARLSKCGYSVSAVNTDVRNENRRRAREARKTQSTADLVPSMDPLAWENAVNEWSAEITEVLSSGTVRTTSDEVSGACCDVVGCDTGVYCDELCTRFAGHPALNAVEYLGEEEQELKQQIAAKATELKYLMNERKECLAAETALKEFKQQMDGLNGEIDRTFEAHRKANDAVEAAEGVMDKLDIQQSKLTEKIADMTSKLGEKVEIESALQAQVAKIRVDEGKLKEALVGVSGAFQKASALLDDAVAALNSFNKLKLLVASTVSKMWTYFSDGVLTPLSTLGLDKDTRPSDFFSNKYVGNKQYGRLAKEMGLLDEHCQKTAKPDFMRVKDERLRATLLDMCAFEPPAAASDEFGRAVMGINEKMLANLQTAQTWHEPLTGHPELTDEKMKELADAGEIAGLRTIENAFGSSAYFAEYLNQWKADGEFLKLLASLTSIQENLQIASKQLAEQTSSLKTDLAALVALKKKTAKELEEAVRATRAQQNHLDLAKGEEEALNAQIDEAESNLSELYTLLDLAEAAYTAAKRAFKEAHEKGTHVGF